MLQDLSYITIKQCRHFILLLWHAIIAFLRFYVDLVYLISLSFKSLTRGSHPDLLVWTGWMNGQRNDGMCEEVYN